jgi:hypothetical protein
MDGEGKARTVVLFALFVCVGSSRIITSKYLIDGAIKKVDFLMSLKGLRAALCIRGFIAVVRCTIMNDVQFSYNWKNLPRMQGT